MECSSFATLCIYLNDLFVSALQQGSTGVDEPPESTRNLLVSPMKALWDSSFNPYLVLPGNINSTSFHG